MDNKYNIGFPDIDSLRTMSKAKRQQHHKEVQAAKILHFVAKIKPFHLKKLWKLTTAYYEFYKYYQMSYLRINPIKLQLIFWWANIKRLRRLVSGTYIEPSGKKVFYFLRLEIVIRKRN